MCLQADAKALLWRFRYSLISEQRALTKFLKCVDWSDAQEAQQVSFHWLGRPTTSTTAVCVYLVAAHV